MYDSDGDLKGKTFKQVYSPGKGHRITLISIIYKTVCQLLQLYYQYSTYLG